MLSGSNLSLLLLLGGLLPLAAGPLVAAWADRSESAKAAVDALIAVSITGIVFLHIWPHALLAAGIWTLIGGLTGLLLPFVLHGSLHAHERRIYPSLVALACLGLAMHATLDGVALYAPLFAEEAAQEHAAEEAAHSHGAEEAAQEHAAEEAAHSHGAEVASHGEGGPLHQHDEPGAHVHDPTDRDSMALLAFAVILHRLPMGLAVWWLAVPTLGRRAAIGLLALIAAGTLAGFGFAAPLLRNLSAPGVSFFEATIAGMLLHVVTGHDHRHHHHRQRPPTSASAVGALAGLALTVLLYRIHPLEKKFPDSLSFHETLTTLSLQVAPWLLLGALIQQLWRHVRPELPLPRPLRELSILPAALVWTCLLGWSWTALAGAGYLGWLLLTTPADPQEREGKTPKSSDALAGLEDVLHPPIVWAMLGLCLVALMEPLIRFDSLQHSPKLIAVGIAGALGALFCRQAVLAALLAFFLVHRGLPAEAVMAFLAAGGLVTALRAARKEGSWPPSRRILGLVFFIALVAAAGLAIPYLGNAADLRTLTDASPAWWHFGALATLAASAVASLFRLGFRGFLRPIFAPVEDPCGAHDDS